MAQWNIWNGMKNGRFLRFISISKWKINFPVIWSLRVIQISFRWLFSFSTSFHLSHWKSVKSVFTPSLLSSSPLSINFPIYSMELHMRIGASIANFVARTTHVQPRNFPMHKQWGYNCLVESGAITQNTQKSKKKKYFLPLQNQRNHWWIFHRISCQTKKISSTSQRNQSWAN